MRNTIKIISAIGLLILLAGVSVKAQTHYRAHIPFDFTIGEKSFRAGDYSFKLLDSSFSQKVVAIYDAKGRGAYMTMTTFGADISKREVAAMVFDRNATQYSLKTISTPTFIANLPRSKAAKSVGLINKQQQAVIPILPNN